ncbi:MAG: saccharopine dehydrogenase, partial [Anaerolineae bacterium]|nr:saccharopine dehydrogenase [Anaerolineae bacterium]
YMVFARWMMRAARLLSPLLNLPPVVELAARVMGLVTQGPNEQRQQRGSAQLWARASAADGQTVEGWLQTAEPYRFTVLSALRCVERLQDEHPVGALTPAQAFGADLVLEIDGSQRFDTLA